MVKFNGKSLAAATIGAAMALGVCGAAQAKDGISGDVSVSYNSHFISYGADVFAGKHKIFGETSPVFVNADLYLTKGNLTLFGNIWADIVGGDAIGNANPLGGSIEEVDLNLGGSYAAGPVTFGAAYGRWNYGGDSEGIVDLSVAFNDADMLVKGFAINPKVLFHIRTDKGAGQLGTGTAIVLSAGPAFTAGPVAVSFPVGVAFFTSENFQNGTKSGYGYSYAGLSLGYPLTFVPSDFGTWTLFTDWIGYFTDENAIPGNQRKNFLTADFGLKLAF